MNWNRHLDLVGKHSILSPSRQGWLGYDDEKFSIFLANYDAAERGTRLHALAAELISLGINLPRSSKTLNMYVNDAIKYRMTPEQPLMYSEVAFGTADAISFENGFLRIHDLKTGTMPVHVEQLQKYAALFCLEYGQKPGNIGMELRFYQNDDIFIYKPDPPASEIATVMEIYVRRSKEVLEYKARNKI